MATQEQIEAVWRESHIERTGADMSNECRLAARIIDMQEEAAAPWQPAGTVGVDAGLLMVGDPCYVLHRSPGHPLDPAFGTDWKDFCGKLDGITVKDPAVQIQGEDWTSAVVVGAFGGDGKFPVFVRKNARGLVVEVKVVFDREES